MHQLALAAELGRFQCRAPECSPEWLPRRRFPYSQVPVTLRKSKLLSVCTFGDCAAFKSMTLAPPRQHAVPRQPSNVSGRRLWCWSRAGEWSPTDPATLQFHFRILVILTGCISDYLEGHLGLAGGHLGEWRSLTLRST